MAVANVFYPRDRYRWTVDRYRGAMLGAAVRVDTPADATDRLMGPALLSDCGVVVEVLAKPDGRFGLVLADGFEPLVEVDSVVAVCRDAAHRHGGGEALCPLIGS